LPKSADVHDPAVPEDRLFCRKLKAAFQVVQVLPRQPDVSALKPAADGTSAASEAETIAWNIILSFF